MAQRTDLSDTAEKQLLKLDRKVAKCIYDFFRNRTVKLDDPAAMRKLEKAPSLESSGDTILETAVS